MFDECQIFLKNEETYEMGAFDSSAKRSVALALLRANCIKFDNFTIASGQESPYYVDIRQLQSYPEELMLVAESMMLAIGQKDFDRFVAIPQGVTPTATVVSVMSGIGMITSRKEKKDHGTKKPFDGDYKKGMKLCILDDVITSGKSIQEVINLIIENCMSISAIWVVVNRQQNGLKKLQDQGYNAHALLTISELFDIYLEEGKITQTQHDIVRSYQIAAASNAQIK